MSIQKIGRIFPVLRERYQDIISEKGLIGKNQISNFSSSYFEGKNAEFVEYGYSRDHRPDKKQVTCGVSTGINGIPTVLTIQRGNVQDKTHMREMLRVCTKIFDKGSLLMFDCGANTPKVKDTIVENNLHYLTLKSKKVGTYKNLIKGFGRECEKFECSGPNTYTRRNHQNGLANSCTSISQRNSARISCTKRIEVQEKDGKRRRNYQKGEKVQCSPDFSIKRGVDRSLPRNPTFSCRHT